MQKLISSYNFDTRPLVSKMFPSETVGAIRSQLKNVKNESQTSVNPLMIEKWIGEFITESESTNVPGT